MKKLFNNEKGGLYFLLAVLFLTTISHRSLSWRKGRWDIGIAWQEGATDFSHYTDLKKRNVPLVLFDRSIDSLNIPSVVIDDHKGGYLATGHLVAQGYKRIAHLAGPQQFQTFQSRLKGYKDLLSDSDLEFDESLIYTSVSFH